MADSNGPIQGSNQRDRVGVITDTTDAFDTFNNNMTQVRGARVHNLKNIDVDLFFYRVKLINQWIGEIPKSIVGAR